MSHQEAADSWQESTSLKFIQLGRIYTPARDEIERVFLDLIPAEPDEPFLAVEIGVGSGWLSAALLRRFSAARVTGLDGSDVMLRHTAAATEEFSHRIELRSFCLEDDAWLSDLSGVRCFLSSLVIHHLDGPGKRSLYAKLYRCLEPGGGLLVMDLLEPAGEVERRYLAGAWDDVVRQQSLALTGDLRAYERFSDDRWNIYRSPDPMDTPSTVLEQLRWLEQTGFTGVSVFWLKAGHAVFGGFKPL